MIKFGFRKLHFYPLMFLLFSLLRKIVEIILRYQPYKNDIDFLITVLIFFSQCLFGFIIYLCYSKKSISRSESKENVLSPLNIDPVFIITK